MESQQPTRGQAPNHVAKAKPDARPMRLALGAGAIAALSALATAIILPPRPATQVLTVQQPLSQPTVDPNATPGTVQVQRPIQYVQLLPGQTAPPGATVIPATAPTPITVIVNVPAPAQKGGGAPAPIIVKTTQSGKVVP
ncbi:MAG: hypothetical protein ACHQ01_04695 [Candidatus Limnocylindrales bacterium]